MKTMAAKLLDREYAKEVAAAEATRIFVYFVQVASGPIKIGWSTNVAGRLHALRVDNHEPLRVLGTMLGGATREAQLHVVFASDRIRGEWFRPSAGLLSFIAEYATPWTERRRIPVQPVHPGIDQPGLPDPGSTYDGRGTPDGQPTAQMAPDR